MAGEKVWEKTLYLVEFNIDYYHPQWKKQEADMVCDKVTINILNSCGE